VTLETLRPGLVPYADALRLQRRLADRVRDDADCEGFLVLLEHPPVITLGRHADRAHVLVPADRLRAAGVDVAETDRGGDATLHAPGQVVLYPILPVARRRLGPRRLVGLLEGAMIETCAAWGVRAGRLPPHPGVWAPAGTSGAAPRKLGAVGLRVASGVSTHGIALNVANDVSLFDLIVPCGLRGFGVTSLSAEAGRPVSPEAAGERLVEAVLRGLDPAPAGRAGAA
jgi:lipoate-protein ligase B